jgi:cell wall-associated NlpC family hydrolase
MQYFNRKLFRSILLPLLICSLVFATELFSQPGTQAPVINEAINIPQDSIKQDTVGHFYKEATIDSLIALGKKFLGLPYHYGGHSPSGFDCSGYVSYLYGQFGYTLPTSSTAMGAVGIEVPYKEARKGDILLFKGRNASANYVGHVALVIEVDSLGLKMMHSCHRGVLIDRYPQIDYYRSRFMGVRRVKL